MKLQNVEGIQPLKNYVVVGVKPRELTGLYLGGNEQATKTQVEMYYGEVEHIGPDVDNPLHCPNLKVGDIAIFSQFAGNYIATNDSVLHKCIQGYDIMATTIDFENVNEKTLTPTADRVLIEVYEKNITDEGIYMTDEDSRDPRLADISYGTILKLGPSVGGGLKKGMKIAYEYYAGEAVREKTSDDSPELRVLMQDAIIFTLKDL